MGQCLDPYRPMFRTARGIKHPEVPRYVTDLRYSLNTQNRNRGPTYASVEALVVTLCTVALVKIG